MRTENRMLGLTRDATFEELPEPDVIVFPGGVGTRALQHDTRVLEWVRHAHATTRFTTSVCTGSLVLGGGRRCSTALSCHHPLGLLRRARSGARRGAHRASV